MALPGAVMEHLTAAILRHYDALDGVTADGWRGPIHPFIGAAYTDAGGTALRVMGIGVNAYCSEDEAHAPSRWASAFQDPPRGWRYPRRVWADLEKLGEGLASSDIAAGRRFAGKESVYLTNVVKRWLPNAKRGNLVEERWFDEGRRVLADELVTLAAASRLPHVVVVVGARPWAHVCWALRASASTWSPTGPTPHVNDAPDAYLNLVSVHDDGGPRPMFMVRIGHSSRPGRGRTPVRLFGDAQFRAVAGLGDNPVSAVSATATAR